MVAQGPDFKIVPLANAPREIREVGVGRIPASLGQGYGVQVVPLDFVSPEEMRKILAPVTNEANIQNVDARRNLMMLGGSEAELESMLELAYMFDVDWLEGISFGYFPLENAEAATADRRVAPDRRAGQRGWPAALRPDRAAERLDRRGPRRSNGYNSGSTASTAAATRKRRASSSTMSRTSGRSTSPTR